jgi:signal transduction histidine kinase
VSVPRAPLISFTCAAVETALENILSGKLAGRVTLRAIAGHGEAVIQVADNAPSSTDRRATMLDSFLTDEREARLRELREWTRQLGGDLMIDADDTGNVISICLPAMTEPVTNPLRQSASLRLERSNH